MAWPSCRRPTMTKSQRWGWHSSLWIEAIPLSQNGGAVLIGSPERFISLRRKMSSIAGRSILLLMAPLWATAIALARQQNRKT
jgi:hypothetical protein